MQSSSVTPVGRRSLSRKGPDAKTWSALALAAALLLIVAGWSAASAGWLRRWPIQAASKRLGRPVHVDGELSVTPGLGGLTVRFTRLHVDQPAWAGPGHMLWIDRGLVRLPWSVLVGSGRLEDVELDGLQLALRRNASGQSNWSAPDGGPPHAPGGLGRLVVRNGVLDVQDLQRGLSFHGAVAASTEEAGASTLTTRGDGLLDGRRWSLKLVSAQQVFGSSQYALSTDLALEGPPAGSSAHFEGALSLTGRPQLEGRLAAAGPDLHAFSQLTGLPLPRTPPYQLSSHIVATRGQVRLDPVGGRIGSSDVAGTLTVAPQPGGRRLDADLRSRSLRMSDLLAVASGGQLVGPRQHAGQLLPTAPIQGGALRKLTGVLHLDAASVQAPTTPTIRSLQLTVRFDHGLVVADPLALRLAHGRGALRTAFDVRGPIPRLSFDANLENADTGEVFKAAGSPVQATFNAAMRLQGSGPSLAAAAAGASGAFELRALNGRLQEAPADVLSADFVRAVISLLTRNRSSVELRCAVARFQLAHGQARATDLRLSTDLGGVEGYGGFNLAANTMDMTLRPTGALSGPTSVRIDGALTHPKATLALDDPGHVLAKALKDLANHRSPPQPGAPGCG